VRTISSAGRLVLLLLLLPALAGCATVLPDTGTEDVSFALMGDTPYNETEVQALDALIDDMNAQDLAFVVHVGDITSGRGPCTDAWFAARRRQYQRLRHPLILLPGDNDWVDCHRGGFDPIERLNKMRQLFHAGDSSIGQRTMPVERQSSDPRFAEYREHVRWITGNVVFIGLNVQGSNNNLGRTPAMDEEYRRRNAAVLAWLDEGMTLARERRLACQHLVYDAPEGVEIAARVHHLPPARLLRAHVGRCPHRDPALRQLRPPRLRDRPRDPEVRNQRVPGRQQDVLRFDVAVHDPVAVRISQRLRDLPRDPQRLVHRELLLAVKPVAE